MKTIQKTAIALAASGLFVSAAYAQTAPAAPEPSPITANVTIVNDYRYWSKGKVLSYIHFG